MGKSWLRIYFMSMTSQICAVELLLSKLYPIMYNATSDSHRTLLQATTRARTNSGLVQGVK